MNNVIEQHYIKHAPKHIKKFTQRAGGVHAAEDIVHNAYERALKYYATFDGLDIDRWINQIVYNAWKDFMQDERGNFKADVEIDDSIVEPMNVNTVNTEFAKQLYAEMSSRSEEHFEVLRLYYVHEYSPMDIHYATGFKRKNVYLIIERFRNAIKEKYPQSIHI